MFYSLLDETRTTGLKLPFYPNPLMRYVCMGTRHTLTTCYIDSHLTVTIANSCEFIPDVNSATQNTVQ